MTSDIFHDNVRMNATITRLKDIASAVMYAAEADKLEHVLERIAQIARELVNARYAALGVPNEHGGLRFFKVAGMSQEEIARVGHLPHGNGLIGAIMHERTNIRLERMQDDPRAAGFCSAHPPMTSLLGVPIQMGQQLFGTLYICDREDGLPFDEQDEWIIETLASYAAVAIAGSQLNDQRSRFARLQEREQIAMDLHDGIIQSLYAIGMQLELMQMNQDISGASLGTVIGGLNDVIDEIRHYIMRLHTHERSNVSTRDCLVEILHRLHTPNTLKVTVEAPDTPAPFTPAVFDAICQMANEAISNAVRHAQASELLIHAYSEGVEFRISIQDNGRGFDPTASSNQNGLGLRNLQQRAALHGGRIDINSQPGHGTRLTIALPTRLY